MNERFTNNFDFLRFFAASAIIISHCFALSLGYSQVFLFDWHLLFGQFGLAALLVISGYLISQSWDRKPRIRNFFWKRTLRLVPGLIISIAMIMFIIAPINTTLPTPEFFDRLSSIFTWMSFPFYTNGGVLGIFANNPVTFVNAPLWTIPFEFLLYCLVAVLGVLLIIKKRFMMLPFIFITALIWLSYYDNPVMNKIRFAIYFFIGALLYTNRDKIRFRWWAAVLLFIPVVITAGTMYMFIFAFIAIPYLVLVFANAKIPLLSKFGKWGDPSYGMYIYAYPIQQTILNFWPAIQIEQFIVLSLSCSIPVAYLSWHMVEKKALSLKNMRFGYNSKNKPEII